MNKETNPSAYTYRYHIAWQCWLHVRYFAGKWVDKHGERWEEECFGEGSREMIQDNFQTEVRKFVVACFGEMIADDYTERCHRFIEESLELVQAVGMSQSECMQLVDYVFNRPVGEMNQEVGGVMVTLSALCSAIDLDMNKCGETELARVWTKIEKIREKQANKPKHSPLPMAVNSFYKIEQLYKEFCADTKRSGGVLITGSIHEWNKFLAERLTTTPQQQGCRWVKASERLPEYGWEGVVRWTDAAAYGMYHGIFYEGNIYENKKVFANQDLLWLEVLETPEQ